MALDCINAKHAQITQIMAVIWYQCKRTQVLLDGIVAQREEAHHDHFDLNDRAVKLVLH